MKTKCFGLFVFLLLPILCNAQLSFGYLSTDQITGTALNANDRSAVILLHGWTAKDLQPPPASAFADGDWLQLAKAKPLVSWQNLPPPG